VHQPIRHPTAADCCENTCGAGRAHTCGLNAPFSCLDPVSALIAAATPAPTGTTAAGDASALVAADDAQCVMPLRFDTTYGVDMSFNVESITVPVRFPIVGGTVLMDRIAIGAPIALIGPLPFPAASGSFELACTPAYVRVAGPQQSDVWGLQDISAKVSGSGAHASVVVAKCQLCGCLCSHYCLGSL
jgi:hypothetical protein